MSKEDRRIEREVFEKIESRRVKRVKDKDLFETVEEVFDRATLMALYELINRGFIRVMHGVVNAGKEARVYWAEDADGLNVAVKIYLTSTSEFKRSMLPYIEGDPRFKFAKRDVRSIIYVWARKEYANLRKAFQVGIRVPKPIAVNKNILIMDFIGDEGVPAPLLKDYIPEDVENLFREVLKFIQLLYLKAGMVHADLSEYNIMVYNDKPVIIDWGQAVILSHPMADEFLVRDINNILRFFSRIGSAVPSFEEVYLWVKGKGQL